ncbi:MAG: flagellar hook assembly protein FlgD [Fretibacterium sp.]|nr:flagellar hook assembly protein FlgD [Fretibacterium sp.]
MPVNNVNNKPVLGGEELKSASRAVAKELDKDAFLRLLIAQLSNQDPLDPMEDREFIAQMAQFSTLEQITNMTRAMENLSGEQKYSAADYVGKYVSFVKGEDAEGLPQTVAARVLAVWFDSERGTTLETEKGKVLLKEIEGVSGPEAAG